MPKSEKVNTPRGGKRPGSGRPKKEGRGRAGTPVYLRLSKTAYDWLMAQRQGGESHSDTIERLARGDHA